MGNDRGGFGAAGGEGMSSTENVERLKEIARAEIRKPTPTQTQRRRVFLSFRYEDKDKVGMLRGQAKNENSELDFIDMGLKVPFNSENAEYIKSGIRERIRQSSVTLVVVSDTTHKSEWVNWEIRETRRLGKRVVVVDVRANPLSRLPDSVSEDSTTKIVKWNHREIMDAINDEGPKPN